MVGGRGRVLAVAVLLALPGPTTGDVRPIRPRPGQVSAVKGLVLRLGEGTGEAPVRTEPVKPAPATALTAADTERVLSRLPALEPEPDDEKDFALREKSLPPPRAGATIKEPFPPPQTAATPEPTATGPLTVVRRSPDGEVPLAPHLSITFSQPMVAVTSHEDLAKAGVPVRLDPEPRGRWRWVGAKTLLFEPEPRFPMATEYRVEVPAGTRSATGGTADAAVRWTFGTPAPVLEQRHPADRPARRQPVLFASFDQAIDPAAVLRTIRLRPSNTPLRLATPDEVKADEDVSRLAEQATQGRWLAFVPESPLPPDAPVTVAVGPGTPSAEGPRQTAKAQKWTFRTYGALKVVSHRCGWNDRCPPGASWQVQFSNPIDVKAWKRDFVRVSPALPRLKADLSGPWLNIHGGSKGRTTYRVTLAPEIRDTFGQALGASDALTFKVGSAEPMLVGETGLVTLDPMAGPRFSVYSVNQDALKVRAHAVTPQDWPSFTAFMQNQWRDRNAQPPGRPVLNQTVKVQGVADELTETRIDLSPALTKEKGHVVLLVEPTTGPTESRRSQQVVAWVQATQIGLDAFADDEQLVAWATSLRDGSPLDGVDVHLQPAGLTTRTGVDGVAVFELGDRGGSVLVARRGNDVALLPDSLGWWGEGSWRRTPRVPGFAWYVFDDRQMYRPGETVKVKGWIRQVGPGPRGDVTPLPEGYRDVEYVARDAQGNEVAKGKADLNAFGGFELSLSLPGTMNLGPAHLLLTIAGGQQHGHAFQVQEFRRPEFEVTTSASEGPHLVGARADVTASARYYAGGALPDAELTWTVSQTPGSYTPPNRDDFTFGTWTPWWDRLSFEPAAPVKVETFPARTDASGQHVLRIDFVEVDPPRPTNVKAEATVMDVNRQGWTAGANLLVHPSALYVGLKSERLFVQRGETLKVDAIVTDIDGQAVGGRPFVVKAERLDWEQVEGEWKETPADVQECPQASKSEAVRCTFQAREGGAWRVTATVADDRQRPNQSQLRIWVAGGKVPPARDVEQEKVTLVPDRKEYRGGDTAEVLVLAPFAPAEGLLTLRRSGLVRHERFTMTGASHTLRVRIEEGFTPNVHVQVDLVGAAPRLRDDGTPDPKLEPRPAFAMGELDLSVPPLTRTLGLTVNPRDRELEPGGQTTLDVELKDAAGQPVAGGEVAVVVVDEAVLSLTGYRLADPMATLYARREAGVRDTHLRETVQLARPEETLAFDSVGGVEGGAALKTMAAPPPPAAARPASRMKAQGIMAESAAAEPEPIRMRTDFAALALFAASVPTDANGRAEVAVTLPDNLTRYRVMAVAATKANRFGKGESTLTARLPIMVRPSAPRFLNFGDAFELPVVVQNQTDAALSVDVAVRAANAELTAGAGRRIQVPARDRVEVRFPAAARRAGTARFQVGGVAGRFADAASFSLPVWTPATTEAFATYGQLDQGAVAQPIAPPSGVVPEFGGLEITTSSTALQALTDAVLYLVAYPFECSEQLASRVLAVAALKDVLAAFQAEGLPKPEQMVAAVDRDLKVLAMIQNEDGGFPFWRRGDRSWPYVSIHVAHALERAQAKGFAVPAPMRQRAQAYLKNIDGRIPKDYPDDVRRSLQAYALYVRHRMGDRDPGRARAIAREAGGVEKLPIEALGWLLPVLSGDQASAVEVAAIRTHLANRATETASTATFAASYGEQGPYLLLHSNRRTDAVLLEALIGDQPKSDLIPKLVEGLLGHRRKGRWDNTQENAFVLLALDRYFGAYEKVTPDFVARAWLGDRLALEQTFRGRSTDRRHVEVPMRVVARTGPAPLVVAKEGAGRLYYRIGMQYAPSSLKLDPADHGFTIERRYEPVDDPADVRRGDDGAWRIKAGARVRVRLSMVADSRRYHVALVDPLPAGLEALNPALAVTGALPPDAPETVDVVGAPGLGGPGRPGHWWWWRRPWFEHQNLRDERVEAFASLLWEGVYTYTYVARATTPGSFVVPPTKAEEMYHPETFGRAASDRVIVE